MISSHSWEHQVLNRTTLSTGLALDAPSCGYLSYSCTAVGLLLWDSSRQPCKSCQHTKDGRDHGDVPPKVAKDCALSPKRAAPMMASIRATITKTVPTCISSGRHPHSTWAMGPILGSNDLCHSRSTSLSPCFLCMTLQAWLRCG